MDFILSNSFMGTVSFILNTVFMLLSVWGLVSFFPRKSSRGNTGSAFLILAIWLGFLGVGLNVFYWRILGDLNVFYEWFSIESYNNFGKLYGDLVWKGLGALSIYMHFYARYKSLDEDEQKHWSPLLMMFYPNTEHCMYKVLTLYKGK